MNYVLKALRSFTAPSPKATKRMVNNVGLEVELFEELGSGRYGVVRVGKRRNYPNEPKIAVKAVPKSKQSLKILQTEIESLEKVNGHPNVMQLIEAFEDRTHVYVLTPLYSGGELFDRIISERFFTEYDAARIMKNLLSAVSHCHSRSVVHRDVKPENLLYSSQNPNAQLVLVDFGMSRVFHQNETMNLQCGSPSYVSPEVLSRSYTEKCDLWSCGIILHILLVGRTPFGNGTDDEILSRVESFEKIQFDSPEWNEISNVAKDFVSKLLEMDPVLRLSAVQALNDPWISYAGEHHAGSLLVRALQNLEVFNKHRRLKKAAIRVIAELARDEANAIRLANTLNSLKRDEYGRIRLSDLLHVIPSLPTGVAVSETGMINPKELIAAALTQSVYLDEQYLLAAFKKFDVSGDGFIDKSELAAALGKDPKADREVVMEAMRHADKDNSGFISFEEFANVVREKSLSSESVKKREKTLKL